MLHRNRSKKVFVVPTEGLEPPHLSEHGPEPCASTNSATWAFLASVIIDYTILIRMRTMRRRNYSAKPLEVNFYGCDESVYFIRS